MKVLNDPTGCIAGEVCAVQPVIAAVYTSSKEIAYSFQGSVYANLAYSPSGYEKMFIGNGCDINNCGDEVSGTLALVNIVNGIASFEVHR